MAMRNADIGCRLKAAYRALNPDRPRAIRLPKEGLINFADEGDSIAIHLTEDAVTSNMQANAAAFEGWALAIKLWLKADRVSLTWEQPEPDEEGRLDLHYLRFLYRVRKFYDMFGGKGEWFEVGTSDALSGCAITSGTGLLCTNVASAARAQMGKPHPEAIAECAFANPVARSGKQFREHFRLERVERQFPVGVFEGRRPNRDKAVFTGGASAIDLIGLSGACLSVFELKAEKNIAVGSLGELLFYAHLITETLGENPRIVAPVGGAVDFDRFSIKRIRAILLAQEFHPLFDHSEFVSTIDAALGRADGKSAPITFEMHKFCGNPEAGYDFQQVR